MESHRTWLIVLLIFLIPLFFINVKSSHDWGDDFAQYLIQAKNIIENKPQTDNQILQSANDQAFAIKAYPVGFPLLIAPLYALFHLEIKPFLYLNTFLLIIAGILCYTFLRKRCRPAIAFLLTLLFCYNPIILELKKQILSENAFHPLFFALLLVADHDVLYKKKYWWITGIIAALLISVRISGITGIISLALLGAFRFFEKGPKNSRPVAYKLFFNVAIAIIIFQLLNNLIFKTETSDLFGFYSSAFQKYESLFFHNAQFYYSLAYRFLPWLGRALPSAWILLSFAGWFIQCRRKVRFAEIIFPVYILMVLNYPYSDGGLRFFAVLLPLMLFYVCYFTGWILDSLQDKVTTRIIEGGLLVLFAGTIPAIIKIYNSSRLAEDGPQLSSSKEMFSFIRTNVPSHSAVVFCRARAMALYSERKSLHIGKQQPVSETFIQFHRHPSLYLVLANVTPDIDIYDPALLHYLHIYKSGYQKIWNNKRFTIWKQL